MRIRFYNTYEPVTTLYRDLVPFLAECGAEIDVVISDAEYRAGRRGLEEALDHPNVAVVRVPSWCGAPRTGLQKTWIVLSYIVGSMTISLFGQKSDLNFFLTQPPLFPAWGYLLQKLRGQPYCCLVMDVYPDVAVRAGLLRPEAMFTRLLTRAARLALRHADAIVVIGRCMREYLESEAILPTKIHLITNWADEHSIAPIPKERNPVRKELGLEGSFVVLYSGNMGRSHYFEDILAAADRLRRVRDLHFVFIGDGIQRERIERAKKTKALTNVHLLPFQPLERLAENLSLGDVHFISLRAGFEDVVVPSKAYGALAAGRPIIYQGHSRGEIARVIEEEDVGCVVEPGDRDGMERAILQYYKHPDLVAKQGARARAVAVSRFSKREALEKYAQLLLAEIPAAARSGGKQAQWIPTSRS